MQADKLVERKFISVGTVGLMFVVIVSGVSSTLENSPISSALWRCVLNTMG